MVFIHSPSTDGAQPHSQCYNEGAYSTFHTPRAVDPQFQKFEIYWPKLDEHPSFV